ncbi:unnamed protein product [Parnassius apollo]|uniref:(apollo) hypothetical protein n=1 Tax=Parnassius apollo TaxID=110799 RepID=A0A8S3W3S6_PARAO|nr:unnamed protein product [Parnassius apollo]
MDQIEAAARLTPSQVLPWHHQPRYFHHLQQRYKAAHLMLGQLEDHPLRLSRFAMLDLRDKLICVTI